jgi:predicted metal-dependent hydrolase
MKQLSLPLSPAGDEQSLKEYFQKAATKPITLALTNNTASMLSIREKASGISIRLHSMFLNAGNDVLDEICEFLKRKKRAIPKVREFINRNKGDLGERKPRLIHIKTKGRYYNLSEISEALNKEYFSSRVSSVITWSKKSSRHVVRKRRLGSYLRDTDTIRINPLLDSRKVPRYFIEYIVYHEMLHASVAIETGNGRQKIHSREFKQREKLFKYYNQALQWEHWKWRS